VIARSLFLLWLGVGIPAASIAQETPPPPVLRAGLEYRFDTEEGKVYVIEGSSNGGQTWVQVSPPVFGDGNPATAKVRIDGADGQRRHSQYRAQEVDPALYGPAPVAEAMAGQTLLLNDNGRERQVILYKYGNRGVLKTDASHFRSFTYRALRNAQDGVRIELTYFDKTTALVTLKFLDPTLGSYQFREFDLAGNVQGVEAGGFGLYSARPPGNADTSLPAALAGTSQVFTQGGHTTRLEFLSPDEVILHRDDGTQQTLGYSYDLNSSSRAMLRISLASGSTLVYDMSLTESGSGTFNQTTEPPAGQPPAPGGNPPPSPGSFGMPPTPTPPPQKPDCPPKSLDGKSIVLSSSDPVTLYFQPNGTGIAMRQRGGSVEATPFTYDYSPNGAASASLSITFPGAATDKVDDYDLDFKPDCTGTYQTNSSENGESNLVSNGGFSTGGGVAGKP
jgi:hypothetical protein